jgi:hypothetical protein
MLLGKRKLENSAEDIELAVRATKEERPSLRKMSKKFNVPKSTIKDFLSTTVTVLWDSRQSCLMRKSS